MSASAGLRRWIWSPSAGLNLILGGGDVGKTTILDAIALLLSPVNPANLPDTSLADLDKAFAARSLPSGLDLQITGGQGASIASMVGLTAQRGTMTLPLASWGAGTRRLSALAIAEQNQSETPITVVDEVERGLEPYRQRVLMDKLQETPTQAFVTAHSPATIGAATKATLWYVDHEGHIGGIKGKVTEQHRARDPELFLSRIAIVAEGATECGAVRSLTPLEEGVRFLV